MRRARRDSCLVCLGLATVILALLAPRARALTVSVSPPDTTATCGDTVQVRVMTDAFDDLKGYQLVFRYDTAVLSYIGATAGDVLTGTGQPYAVLPLPDAIAPPDTIWVDCAQLGGSTSGPGVLIYFSFETLDVGASPIECLWVEFRDSENVAYTPDCVSGIVRVPYCPTPALSETWGRIKTLYR